MCKQPEVSCPVAVDHVPPCSGSPALQNKIQSPSCGTELGLMRESRGSHWPSPLEKVSFHSVLSSKLTTVQFLNWGMFKFEDTKQNAPVEVVLETRSTGPTIPSPVSPPTFMHSSFLLLPYLLSISCGQTHALGLPYSEETQLHRQVATKPL